MKQQEDRKASESMSQHEKAAWADAQGVQFKQEFGDHGEYLWRSELNGTLWIGHYPSREAALDGAIEAGATFEGAVALKAAAERKAVAESRALDLEVA